MIISINRKISLWVNKLNSSNSLFQSPCSLKWK